MPPAGLEPAALCLASSIRLSLTARQSWGCWLDYILDITVPTRIVSEDPCSELAQVSCGLPNPRGLLLGPAIEVPEALRASPHTGSSTQWVPDAFPIKAPTRQMLYPLSYRGTFNKARMLAQNKKRSPAGAISFEKHERLSLGGAGVFFGFSEHATAVERIIDDLAHCRSFRIDVHSVARFQVSNDA